MRDYLFEQSGGDRVLLARYYGGQTGNGWCGLRLGLDDFWPSCALYHRSCLDSWDLARAVGTIRALAISLIRPSARTPAAKTYPGRSPVGSSDTSGLSHPPAVAGSFWLAPVCFPLNDAPKDALTLRAFEGLHCVTVGDRRYSRSAIFLKTRSSLTKSLRSRAFSSSSDITSSVCSS
jgi:hypothetical protein